MAVLALATHTSAHAQPGTAVCRVNADQSITTCRIDQPVVSQRSFPYRNVTFRPGDSVTVAAGGCVQTGGSGATWKRYVNPSGPNSDHLYWGLINIPGNPPGGGLVRIQSMIGRPIIVPDPMPPGNTFLTLGYMDDDYGDNGYSSHDDGTEDQCKGRDGGPAWVSLTIAHGRHGSVASAPLDVVGSEFDMNGAFLNPRFFWETNHADHPDPGVLCDGFAYTVPDDPGQGIRLGNPPCTTQFGGIDVPSGFNDALCTSDATSGKLHGHVNWFPATVTGRVIWAGHTDWTHKGDDDYNFDLFPSNNGLLTTTHPSHIEVEFDSDETVDHFSSAWWTGFHTAVDQADGSEGENTPAAMMVNDKDAIITGLINLDSEHNAYSELHPVYAMAIHLNSDPSDDEWAIFARNWGNEGFCSQDQHLWDVNPLAVFLPGVSNATDFTLLQSDFRSNNDVRIEASFVRGGLLLNFFLGTPESGSLVDGSLRVRWTVAPAAVAGGGAAGGAVGGRAAGVMRAGRPAADRSIRPLIAAVKAEPKSEPEEFPLTRGLPPEKLAQVEQQLRKAPPAKDGIAVQPARVAAAPVRVRRVAPRVRAVPDTKGMQRQQLRAQVLCAAYDNNIPGAPGACTAAPRRLPANLRSPAVRRPPE